MSLKNIFTKANFIEHWLKIFSSVFVFLGFTSSVVAQYGAPVAYYSINGQVRSAKTNEVLKDVNIQINRDSKYDNSQQLIKTDSNGNFGVFMRVQYFDNLKWKLEIADQEIGGRNYTGKDTLIEVGRLHYWERDTNQFTLYLDEEELEKEKGKRWKKVGPYDVFRKEELINTEIIKEENHLTSSKQPKSIAIKALSQISEVELPDELENSDWQWKLFPNPSRDVFYISADFQKPTTASIWIYTMKGELCYSETFNAKGMETKQLNVNFLSKGTYLVLLKTEDKSSVKELIIL